MVNVFKHLPIVTTPFLSVKKDVKALGTISYDENKPQNNDNERYCDLDHGVVGDVVVALLSSTCILLLASLELQLLLHGGTSSSAFLAFLSGLRDGVGNLVRLFVERARERSLHLATSPINRRLLAYCTKQEKPTR